jgi:hypothetical protein
MPGVWPGACSRCRPCSCCWFPTASAQPRIATTVVPRPASAPAEIPFCTGNTRTPTCPVRRHHSTWARPSRPSPAGPSRPVDRLPRPDQGPGAARVRRGGRLAAGAPSPRLLARYAEVSGRQVDDIDYYLILARWTFAVVLEQGFRRAGDDVKLQAFGSVVLKLIRAPPSSARARHTGPDFSGCRDRNRSYHPTNASASCNPPVASPATPVPRAAAALGGPFVETATA